MPECKRCGSSFPNTMEIDGKLRHLHKRRYCLSCSPFDEHNTKRIHLSGPLICDTCGKEYEYRRGYGTKSRCGSCVVNYRRFELKQKCVVYKGGKCQVCGYDRCLQAMDFHHLRDKDFQISGKHCLSWKRIKSELDKCVLLCKCCHAELHAGVIDLGVNPNGAENRL